jgi:hypothetical protein
VPNQGYQPKRAISHTGEWRTFGSGFDCWRRWGQVRAAVLSENVAPRLENSAYLCTVDGERMRSDPITARLMASIDSHPNTTAWLAPGRHCICSPARWGEFYRMIIMVDQADPRAPYIPTDANWNTKADVHKLRDSFTDHKLRFRRVLDLMKPEDCRL